MAQDDETNSLLREIRDLLAAQQGKYEKNVADNRQMYQEYSAKVMRRQLIVAIVLGVGVALILMGRN
jgi:hypothetical protein